MKAQSALMPLKAEMEFDNRRGEALSKPQVVKTNTCVNKGHDRDWYEARNKKVQKDFGGIDVHFNDGTPARKAVAGERKTRPVAESPRILREACATLRDPMASKEKRLRRRAKAEQERDTRRQERLRKPTELRREAEEQGLRATRSRGVFGSLRQAGLR